MITQLLITMLLNKLKKKILVAIYQRIFYTLKPLFALRSVLTCLAKARLRLCAVLGSKGLLFQKMLLNFAN